MLLIGPKMQLLGPLTVVLSEPFQRIMHKVSHNHQWPFMLVFGLVVIHLINQVPLTGQVVSLITLKLHSLWVLSLFWLLIILQANNTVILINLVLGNPSKPMVVKLMEDTTKHKMISRNWKVDNLLTQ